MTESLRQRGNSPADGDDYDCDHVKTSGSSGVALKKEIGLVSACGIIVGKSCLLERLVCFSNSGVEICPF